MFSGVGRPRPALHPFALRGDLHGWRLASLAAGDVNGDGRADIIMGDDGPSKIGPRILIVSGADTTVVLGDFKAFDSNFRGGLYVAAGDVNGDGRADVIVGTGAAATSAAAGEGQRVVQGSSSRL